MKRSRVAAYLVVIGAVAAIAYFGNSSLRSAPAPAALSKAAASNVDAHKPPADLVSQVRREPLSAPRGELFALPPLAEAPAAPRVALTPLAPPQPTFPYRYVGRLDDRVGLVEIYLVRSDGRLQPVKEGTVLDSWRIDRLTHDTIEVTYMPGEARQSIMLASIIGEAERSLASRDAAGNESSRPAEPLVASGTIPATRSGINNSVGSSAISSTAPAAGGRLGEAAPARGTMPTDNSTPTGRKLGQ
jgi:hypothetical protein